MSSLKPGNLSRPLESNIEKDVSEYAKRNGCLVVKLNLIGQIGWPDRMYLRSGKLIFIEFKRPGSSPRRAQIEIHRRIEAHGFPVFVIDSIEEGREVVRVHLLGVR
jgi:hypothetical protein